MSIKRVWKAVKVVDGRFHALGMGPADDIHLPVGEWLDGGEFGFACGRTKSVANGVIYQINRRKVLPIPKEIKVIEVYAKVRKEKDWGAVICDEIYIPHEGGCYGD